MDGGSHVNYLNWHTTCTHKNSNVIPALTGDSSGSSNNSVQRDFREMKNCVMSTLCCFKSPTLLFLFRDLDGCKS